MLGRTFHPGGWEDSNLEGNVKGEEGPSQLEAWGGWCDLDRPLEPGVLYTVGQVAYCTRMVG